METDHREIRFGTIAVEKGFITPDQVIEALQIQVEENLSTAKHTRIGTILLEKGLMTISQVNGVLESMDVPV